MSTAAQNTRGESTTRDTIEKPRAAREVDADSDGVTRSLPEASDENRDPTPQMQDTSAKPPLNSRLQRVLARHRSDYDACASLAYQVKALRAREKKSAQAHARELEKTRAQLHDSQSKCKASEARCGKLEKSLSALELQNASIEKERTEARRRYVVAEKRVEELTQLLNEAKVQTASLQQKLDVSASSEKSSHGEENEVDEMRKKATERETVLRAEVDAQKAIVKELESRIRKKDKKYTRMETELTEYLTVIRKTSDNRQAEMTNNHEVQATKMKQEYEKKIDSWQSQVEELTAALTETSTRYTTLESQVIKLRADAELYKAREESMLKDVAIMTRERESMTSSSRREIERFSTVIHKLKDLYTTKEAQYDKLFAEKVALENDLEAFEKLLDTEDARLEASRRRKRRKTANSSMSSVSSGADLSVSRAAPFNFSFEMTPRKRSDASNSRLSGPNSRAQTQDGSPRREIPLE